MMEQMLFEAVVTGNVDDLPKIISNDRLILDKAVAGRLGWSPLHMAASYGHTDFVKELLNRKRELARVLDLADRTALHLASSEGHVEVVKELMQNWPEMCLVRDREGKNPLHVAAVNGKVDVLENLVRVRPHAARARLNGEETILHLCVKYHQTEALKKLLELINDEEFVQAKDSSGNTILHLAVMGEQLEIVEYITKEEKMKKKAINVTNASGHTAMDVATLAKDNRGKDDTTEIETHLLKAKAKGASSLEQGDWVNSNKEALMVVASLIATIAFQVGVNPPGGVWQDNLERHKAGEPVNPPGGVWQENSDGHRAGEAVMAYNYPDSYPWFIRFSTIGFIASLSTILLLNSGLRMKRRTYSWLLMVVMWLSITFTAASYALGIVWVTPKKDRESLTRTIVVAVIVFCSVMAILFIVHTVRLIKNMVCERLSIRKAVNHIAVEGARATETGTSSELGKCLNFCKPANSNGGRQVSVGAV
ncbi:unnamed protein product [Thlaspi arvense]|uniref:PGG domain-containing protein n=1 Tax=Thlaspi arvense TaxID=13288 RepID=A0AAU9RLF1_THLAR|nr:unnamed protein product [Thlaspi arvense]